MVTIRVCYLRHFRSLPRAAACALLLVCVPTLAWAWGREGHAIIARIAERQLTEPTRVAISALLVDDRDAMDQASGRTRLEEISSWADEIRSTPTGRPTAPWHFENIPICGNPEPDRVCPHGQCVSAELLRMIDVLKDRSAPPRARNEALKWVVHLVGDIHQPLHVSDHDDRGGNDVMVSWFGQTIADHRPINLHFVWDTLIIERMLNRDPGARTIVGDDAHRDEARDWARGSVADWAAEGNSLARTFVYPGLGNAFACGRPIAGIVPLAEAYDEGAEPIVRLRLRQAGFRLARILNASLDPDYSAPR